jgi:hypothetical protein
MSYIINSTTSLVNSCCCVGEREGKLGSDESMDRLIIAIGLKK